jgi:decaprenylphospho-beta-D-erythro-pentofuranosid-2-ulose 2-reductase
MSTSATTRNNRTALVVGATSSLAQSLCRGLAARGFEMILAGRDGEELELLSADLTARHGVACRTMLADLASPTFDAGQFAVDAGDVSHAVIAAGVMGNADPTDLHDIAYVAHLNYTVPAQIAAAVSAQMHQHGGGTLIVISSVAGDRGRQSNMAYGAAKAALTAFASGLRNYYAKRGVHVMTVKPGFTDTPMTWGMKSPLMAGREYVAAKILAAMDKGRNSIYVPWFWQFIMLIICHIPEKIFKKLKL